MGCATVGRNACSSAARRDVTESVKLTKLPFGYFSGLMPLPSNSTVAPSFSALSINPSILSLAATLITGPKSVPSSKPPSIFNPLALSASSSSHSFVSPTMTNVLSAMHRWPAAPNAAPAMAFKAWFLFASGRTQAWFLAPRLAWTRFPLAEARV